MPRVWRQWSLLGRLFFALIFEMAAPDHFSSQTIAYAASRGVPLASPSATKISPFVVTARACAPANCPTAPQVTIARLWLTSENKFKEGRHVGLESYDLVPMFWALPWGYPPRTSSLPQMKRGAGAEFCARLNFFFA